MIKLALILGVVFLYAIVSHRTEKWFTAPIVFTTIGVVLSDAVLGWFTLEIDSLTLQILLKGALALLLFSEATTLNADDVSRESSIPVRLLGLAMPLVIIVGLAIAGVMFGVLSFWEAALVGIILAPTDAALGQSVIENTRVPEVIRRGLFVESGLNDGLAVPLALFAAGAAEVVAGTKERTDLLTLIVADRLRDRGRRGTRMGRGRPHSLRHCKTLGNRPVVEHRAARRRSVQFRTGRGNRRQWVHRRMAHRPGPR